MIGWSSPGRRSLAHQHLHRHDHDRGTIGGFLGAGVDVHVSRHLSIGLMGGFNWMADFPEPRSAGARTTAASS